MHEPSLSGQLCQSLTRGMKDMAVNRSGNCKADVSMMPCSPASRQYSEASEGPPQFFEQLCGRFEVNQEQMDGFQDFSRSMRQCSLAFFLVSATNIILTISQVLVLTCCSRVCQL